MGARIQEVKPLVGEVFLNHLLEYHLKVFLNLEIGDVSVVDCKNGIRLFPFFNKKSVFTIIMFNFIC